MLPKFLILPLFFGIASKFQRTFLYRKILLFMEVFVQSFCFAVCFTFTDSGASSAFQRAYLFWKASAK